MIQARHNTTKRNNNRRIQKIIQTPYYYKMQQINTHKNFPKTTRNIS